MRTHPNLFSDARAATRPALVCVGVFSLVINVLLLTTSLYLMQIFDRVISSGSLSTLVYLTLIAAFALLVLAILEVVRIRLLGRVSNWLGQTLGPPALARTMDSSAPHGGGASVLTDLATLRAFVAGSSILSIFDAPWVPVYLFVIYLLHPLLGHIALAGAVVLLALAICNDLVTRSPIETANNSAQRSMQIVREAGRNAEVVDALGLTRGILRRWAQEDGESLRLQLMSGDRAALIQGLSKFARLFVQIAVLGVGAWLVIAQSLTGGAMIAASLIMARALAPVEQAIGTWKQAVLARQARRRLKEFFRSPARRRESRPLGRPAGHLSAEGVMYGFDLGKPAVLKGVSFKVQPGRALAFMGPSAAGKSTLARCLVGIERPGAGTVRLDGANIFDWPRDAIARHLGYLPQNVELFSGSVAENIARLEDVDMELVLRAAALADCHEMILKLESGYETEVGEGGVRLSGGQRQRIALARALYGEPRLIVLDEPNANLDTAGEAALSRAIAGCKAAGAAIVVMGHRPSTLAVVDDIAVLIEGRIEAFGPRQEVLERITRSRQADAAVELAKGTLTRSAARGLLSVDGPTGSMKGSDR